VKVLLTAVQFSASISGLQRHALNLVRALLRQPEISGVHLVIAPWQRTVLQQTNLDSSDRLAIHIADMHPGAAGRNLWYYLRLPRLAETIQPDIVHLSYPVPVRASAFQCPVVLTLHDLYPYEIPRNFGFSKVLFNRAILQHCVRNADAIVCVSGSTLLQLRKHVPRSCWSRAQRIYNCVEPSPDPLPEPSLRDLPRHPFLLTVSQHRRNKNIPLLIRVFHRLLTEHRIQPDMRLLVVGIPGPETSRLHHLVSELEVTDRVLFVHGVSDAGLQWCYRNAEALVAPSETEGFGLPVVEALLAGCRVICSDIPVFREIVAAHCRLVALGFGAEARFADAIVDVLRRDPSPPLALPQFSLEAIGAQHVDLYNGLLPALFRTSNASSLSAATPALLEISNSPITHLGRDNRC
jgi:glycosyltransferase involved in cell wall biosynthesis